MALTLTIPKKLVEQKLDGAKVGSEVNFTGKITGLDGDATVQIGDFSSPDIEEAEDGEGEEENESPAKKKLSAAARAVLSSEDS